MKQICIQSQVIFDVHRQVSYLPQTLHFLELIGRQDGIEPLELCPRKVDAAGSGSKHSSVTCAEHPDMEAFCFFQ